MQLTLQLGGGSIREQERSVRAAVVAGRSALAEAVEDAVANGRTEIDAASPPASAAPRSELSPLLTPKLQVDHKCPEWILEKTIEKTH